MHFGEFRLKPRPEHMDGVLSVLESSDLVTPQQIVTVTGLSLTAVRCALSKLESQLKLEIVTQHLSPKTRVRLRKPLND